MPRNSETPKVLLRCSIVLVMLACCIQLAAQSKSSVPPKLPAADKVIDNYLKAIGGKKRALAVRDATSEWTIRLQDQVQGTARFQLKQPGATRSEMTFGNGRIISAATPRSAWVHGLTGPPRTLTGPEAAAAKLQAALEAAHLVEYKKANVMARVLDLIESPLGPAYRVEFSTRGGGRLRYLFSITSSLLIGIDDEARKISSWFEDYRPERNLLEPHTLRINLDGTGELRLTLDRISYNGGLSAAIFDPPRTAEALDVVALLREVSKNQEEVEKRSNEYSFVQKETDREIDSKGVVKKETVRVSELYPIPNRPAIEKLISENGVPLTAERAAKEEKRVVEEFEKAERDKDKDAQKAEERKAERARKRSEGDDDDPEISRFLKVCEFISPRHEQFQNRNSIVFDFRVKPGFKPANRQESLIAKLVGVIWIDPVDKQVMRLEARLAEGFKMAGGLLLSLRPGAAMFMEQTRMSDGVWLPRLTEINLSVKVLLFGGGDINKTIEWSDYKHFSADVSGYTIGSPESADPARKKP